MSLVSHEGVRLPIQFPNWSLSRGTPPPLLRMAPGHPPGVRILGDVLERDLGPERVPEAVVDAGGLAPGAAERPAR